MERHTLEFQKRGFGNERWTGVLRPFMSPVVVSSPWSRLQDPGHVSGAACGGAEHSPAARVADCQGTVTLNPPHPVRSSLHLSRVCPSGSVAFPAPSLLMTEFCYRCDFSTLPNTLKPEPLCSGNRWKGLYGERAAAFSWLSGGSFSSLGPETLEVLKP